MTLYVSLIKYQYSNELISVNIHSSIISAIKYIYYYIVDDALRYCPNIYKKLPFYIKNTDDLRDFFNTYPTKFEWHIEEKAIIDYDEDDEDDEDDDYDEDDDEDDYDEDDDYEDERDLETCTIHK